MYILRHVRHEGMRLRFSDTSGGGVYGHGRNFRSDIDTDLIGYRGMNSQKKTRFVIIAPTSVRRINQEIGRERVRTILVGEMVLSCV